MGGERRRETKEVGACIGGARRNVQSRAVGVGTRGGARCGRPARARRPSCRTPAQSRARWGTGTDSAAGAGAGDVIPFVLALLFGAGVGLLFEGC